MSRKMSNFEKKFHDILNLALSNKKILFFDEAHTILDTGSSDGGVSGADILKPYLMRPDFQIIGATTVEEANIFYNDKAFARRFNFIRLEQLTVENTKENIKNKYHQLTNWEPNLIETIFFFSDNTLKSRNYPDKALDFSISFFRVSRHQYSNSMKLKKHSIFIIE